MVGTSPAGQGIGKRRKLGILRARAESESEGRYPKSWHPEKLGEFRVVLDLRSISVKQGKVSRNP